MVKTRELSIIERAEIVGAYKCGVKLPEISKRLEISYKTVRNIIQKFNNNNTVENMMRSRWPNVLSERNVRSLVHITKKNRREMAASFTAELNHALLKPVSEKTVCRALYDKGYHACAGKRKPLVTEHNRKKHLFFARFANAWSYEWNEMIFNDGSRFVLFSMTHKWVWRQAHEKYA